MEIRVRLCLTFLKSKPVFPGCYGIFLFSFIYTILIGNNSDISNTFKINDIIEFQQKICTEEVLATKEGHYNYKIHETVKRLDGSVQQLDYEEVIVVEP